MSFDFTNFNKYQINIYDIAHALSHICRFNGHCDRFYSVAEHSVRASYIESDHEVDARAHILLHDATEAYLGDVVTPLKCLFPEYIKLENKLAKIIFDKYCLESYNSSIENSIHFADKSILQTEFKELFNNDDSQFGWSPEQAKFEFIWRYNDLVHQKLIRK